MHLPSVEMQDGRRGWQDITSALYPDSGPCSKAWTAACATKVKEKGENRRYWSPLVISPGEDSGRQVKIWTLTLLCLHAQQDLRFMQTTPPADLRFRRLPGKMWKAKKKKLLLLLCLQFSSLHSCSSRELTPLHRASWLHHSVLHIISSFNSWLHHAVTTLLKKDL